MIKIDAGERIVRETTAPFEHMQDGEVATSEIRVRYFSPTTQDIIEQRNEEKARKAEDETASYWLSEALVRRLESLPDLVDGKGKPVKITLEFLNSIAIKNLPAIQDAIAKDIEGK
jgi:hypothetical protein